MDMDFPFMINLLAFLKDINGHGGTCQEYHEVIRGK
jgi:hypothetical protein